MTYNVSLLGLTRLAVKIKSKEEIHNGIVNAIMGKKVAHKNRSNTMQAKKWRVDKKNVSERII